MLVLKWSNISKRAPDVVSMFSVSRFCAAPPQHNSAFYGGISTQKWTDMSKRTPDVVSMFSASWCCATSPQHKSGFYGGVSPHWSQVMHTLLVLGAKKSPQKRLLFCFTEGPQFIKHKKTRFFRSQYHSMYIIFGHISKHWQFVSIIKGHSVCREEIVLSNYR